MNRPVNLLVFFVFFTLIAAATQCSSGSNKRKGGGTQPVTDLAPSDWDLVTDYAPSRLKIEDMP